jgi:hypothetical protein
MKAIEPSWMLKFYCSISLVSGILFSLIAALLVNRNEIDMSSSIILILSWNVLLLMILPLVLDWTERKYCKARFIALEEIAKENPELKKYLDEQCEKLSLSQLRLAVIETNSHHCFTYGLWRQNPRLFIPAKIIQESNKVVPSIEVELSRFARQDLTLLFFMFFAIEIIINLLTVQLT